MNIDQDNELTGAVIGAAISVHRILGPGVDEAAYEEALSTRFRALGLIHECQKPLPLVYKGAALDCGFRLDLLIENRLPVELKAVEKILPIHEAQLLTYMRLGELPLGLLINFEVPILTEGIRRRALTKARSVELAPPVVASGDNAFDGVSAEIIGASLEVHRTLGPGLLRSVYEECLCHELQRRTVRFIRDFRAPLIFEGNFLAHPPEISLVVADNIPVFCLSVSSVTQLHQSRLLARLRQMDWAYGFLINFNAPILAQGIRRIENKEAAGFAERESTQRS